MLHIVTVDLTAPGLKVLVTPGTPSTHNEQEIQARTTSEFLTAFKLQLAVNASFFHPFAENTPWNYYPRSGEFVGAVGQAISNGVPYSDPLPGWSVFCVSSQQQARILAGNTCPPGTMQAVAGSTLLVQDGKAVAMQPGTADSDGVYSRTVVAIDRSGHKLWLLLVDDKQWLYSEGVSLQELAEIAIALGADAALNLDGGGSTTLVQAKSIGYKILNSPVHTKIPMRERPVANHLGFYALPLAR
jgi:exopolysaccharide biosynthesis protein